MSATSSLGWDTAGASIRRCPRDVQEFKRALNLPDQVDRNARIARGRLDMPMPEQVLDYANIDTLLKEMGGKTMSQRVDGDRLTEPGRRAAEQRYELAAAAHSITSSAIASS